MILSVVVKSFTLFPIGGVLDFTGGIMYINNEHGSFEHEWGHVIQNVLNDNLNDWCNEFEINRSHYGSGEREKCNKVLNYILKK